MSQRPATTSIVTTALVAGQKARAAVSTAAQTTAGRVQVTAAQMATPGEAARAINDMQGRLTASTAGARTNPRNDGAVFIKGVVFVSGVAQLIRHNLGRDPVGYAVVDTYPGAAGAILLRRATLPAGMSIAQAINVIPSASGTGTVEVF